MLLAFDLLNKYKKDSKFIEKDIKTTKKKSELVFSRNEDLGGDGTAPVTSLA